MSLMSTSPIFFCSVLFLPYVVRGTLTHSGTVAVDCGGQQTFTCNVTGITTNSAAGWTIMGLVNITSLGSNGVITANSNPRINTSTGGNVPISTITIANFTMSDNGGTVQCINTDDSSEQGTANITVEPLHPPSNTTATTVGHDCTVITLQWDKPDTPSDITSTVSCTPSSTACGACTSSPCDITGLVPNTEYSFNVTLNSGMCGTSTNTTAARTMGVPQLLNVDTQLKTCTSVGITWEQQPGASTTFVTVTYCPTSSPKCGTSTTCTINPCTIYGLAPNTSYDIIVIPNNTCGMGSAIAAIVTTPPDFPYMETPPTSCLGLSGSWYSVPVGITFAVTFTVSSVVSSSVTAVVMYFVCVRKKRSGVVNDVGTGGDIYEDPDRSGDIKMDPSPAYQTVPSVCVQ